MNKKPEESLTERWLDIEEVRLVSDLRIMHAKVNELFEIVDALKSRYDEQVIRKYADHPVLDRDIARVDEIYLWFLRLKEEGLRLQKK
jgi:hypothetical protein